MLRTWSKLGNHSLRMPALRFISAALLVLAFSAASVHFYLLSLTGGDLEWIKQHMGTLGVELVLSVLLYSAAITLVYTLRLPRAWRLVLGVILVVKLALVRAADRGESFARHGNYNMILFVVLAVPLNLVVFATVLLYRSTRHFWRIAGAFVVSLLLLTSVSLVRQRARWRAGFLGRGYQPDAAACRFPEPNWPFIDLLPAGAQNFWTGSQSCPLPSIDFDARLTQHDALLTIDGCPPGLPVSYDVLPDTRSWPASEKKEYVLNRMIVQRTVRREYTGRVRLDVRSTETVIARCGHEEKLLLRVARTLPPARVSQGRTETQRPNILLLSFDAVSRRGFHRRLRRTSKLLEELHEPGRRQLYQFSRSHAVGFNTDDNSRSMYTGTIRRSGVDPVWQQFRDAGYVVAHTDTSCQDWSSQYEDRNTSITAVDHEMLGPACWPPYFALRSNPYGNFNGPFSIRRRCAFGDYVHAWNFDFTRRVRDAYPDWPSLLSVNFIEGHEGTGEVLATVDRQLHDFLAELRDDGSLDNTIVLFFADHGLHMGLNFLFTQNGRIEHQNPVLHILLPAHVALRLHAKDGSDGLLANEQALVTHYNTHCTLRVLADMEQWPPSRDSPYWDMSLFEPQPRNLTCEAAGIRSIYCQCEE
ncbi:sulfatase domain-containing protein [Hirsutella rhossiliensis]|uniref:Sulfatase domain-containing protein n=1 Tax=Hirsutella rhossiliensis TaxID=111463 RepID=A0A9P8MVJ4_9HYPO|nr:sulfatase domain-containing protein [Hirsutella rhossiliensis]KAH0962025.1 sulfatase domain-containing protein [Hirsutella rhossiliensis]